jgi:hypothetical protein
MKKIYFLIALAIISCFGIRAQKPIIVSEDSLRIGSSLLPGLSVIIPEANYAGTLKNWTKLLESGTKSKVVTENTEMTIFGANIKNLTDYPVNVYSILLDRDSALYLTAAFELKKDVYIERATGEAELANAKSILFNFGKDQYIEKVSEEVKVEENKLRNLEKELGSLQRDQSGMEKSIRKNNRTISTERERLISLNTELTTLTATIAEERLQYTSMEEGEARVEEEKYLKNLEKQRKRLSRAITSSEKKINKAERAISKATNDIPRNDRIQQRYMEEVAAQEAVLQKFLDKLNTIKGYQ